MLRFDEWWIAGGVMVGQKGCDLFVQILLCNPPLQRRGCSKPPSRYMESILLYERESYDYFRRGWKILPKFYNLLWGRKGSRGRRSKRPLLLLLFFTMTSLYILQWCVKHVMCRYFFWICSSSIMKVVFLFLMLGVKPKASGMLGNYSTTELHPQLLLVFHKVKVFDKV